MTRELELSAACAAMERLAPGAEPCSECLETWPADDLDDCSDIAPLAGLCCPRCAAVLKSDAWDEMPDDGELRRREAAVRVGSGNVVQLFGRRE